MIGLVHDVAVFNGKDLLLCVVVAVGLGFSLINEIRGFRK